MVHANIRNNEIIDFNSKYANEDILRVETTEEMYQAYLEDKNKVIYQGGQIIENPNYEKIRLELKKQELIGINDVERDKKLEEGVVYSNILFDSDTDQKINLLAMYNTMCDDDTILWYGLDNQPLLCAKSDLLEIGKLITDLHKFCWNNNAFIKEQIDKAKTIEDLEEINVKY